jgi:phosphoenolpyruvate-protein kinase (PTS system EI component)
MKKSKNKHPEVEALESQMEVVAQQIKDAANLLKEKEKELVDLHLKVVKVLYGVELGSIVQPKKGDVCMVTEIRYNNLSRPWLKGHPKKKDGTWSRTERYLYDDWELVK